MKKIFSLVVLLMTSIVAFAQAEKDVTKFLGIPVDGYKSEMISKLKAKGFVTSTKVKDALEGEFNGKDVYVSVVTNNNKVYRIYLEDKNYVSESDIRIRFNNLISQFENNSKYFGADNEYISEDEDLGYNITVKDKRYQAIFYQESGPIEKELESVLEKKFGVTNPQDLPEDKKREASEYVGNYLKDYLANRLSNKQVWFMIDERYGKYRILMFYDNCYNQANGEDL